MDVKNGFTILCTNILCSIIGMWNTVADGSIDVKSVFTFFIPVTFLTFLPARRYASAGYRDRNVSVCLSVRHAPVLCQNEES